MVFSGLLLLLPDVVDRELGHRVAELLVGCVPDRYRRDDLRDACDDRVGWLRGQDLRIVHIAVLHVYYVADLVPDNNITGGLLFGLKEIKNAGAFSVDFLENYEKNKDSLARFFRDSGDMVEDISKFVQGAVTTNEGFLAGLKGKALVTAQMWGTTVTSLYTTGSYAIGDMIDKYQNGTLDWGSGAESWGKGAVGGIGKIHKFLTLGLVDPDMNKTWDIYMKHVDRNVELINKYGNNWLQRFSDCCRRG